MGRDGDTIFALSSGALPAAIGVIRISGPAAVMAAESLVGPLPPAREARLRRIVEPLNGELLDEGLVVWFPRGRSETGEDLVELHCHGARAAVRAVERALAAWPGVRQAEAGEFARRALLNGKMDLTRLEGLGDLLAAETDGQRQAALAMMGGALARRIADWTHALTSLAARVEAVLDFADEDDVDEQAVLHGIHADVAGLAEALGIDLARPGAERLKDGIRVVIAGPPNAGKSTLLNALADREAAIVSPLAGTTRDVIEVPLALGGIPLLLSDTAGLREESRDPIELIGIERAMSVLERADIVLWLGDACDMPGTPERVWIAVRAKADLALGVGADSSETDADTPLPISAISGFGMDALKARMMTEAQSLLPRPGDYALSARQRAILRRAMIALGEGAYQADPVLLAESLRAALAAFDELTGRVSTEAVLDELFSGFCIGK